MITKFLQSRSQWILVVVALAVAGCSGSLGGPSAPTRYYVLSATAGSTPIGPGPAQSGPIVAVIPVDLAEYLDTPGIVTRSGANEIVRGNFDQWAGPLAGEVSRVVGENLAAMIPTDRLTVSAGTGGLPIDYSVLIEIATFERDDANKVTLLARWVVFQGSDRAPIVLRTSRIEQATTDASYNAAVVAMNTVLGKLCEEIAGVIVAAGN
jgi:uncharacterized lipoprotein YmbA